MLPLQGRIRQEGVTGEESSPDSEGEATETPKATQGREDQPCELHYEEGGSCAPIWDSQPTLTSLSSPEHMTGDKHSSEDEEYPTSSALTARGSTTGGSPPSTTEAVEDDRQSAATEPVSDISSNVHPLPDQTITDVNSEQEQESEPESDSDTKHPVPTAQRRSARSTKGLPPVCYGQVQINSTIITELERPTRYQQGLYVPCYQLAEMDKP